MSGRRTPPGMPKPHEDGGRNAALSRAIANAQVAVMLQDSELAIVWAQNLPRALTTSERHDELTDFDLFPATEAARIVQAKREVLAGAGRRQFEVEVPGADRRWYELWIDVHDAEPPGVITTIVEISEHKRREQTLRTLLREVSHRSKNLLAIMQSIATQTGRHSGTVPEFLARFTGRLQSLSSSQDLVTSSNWRGADLGELVACQVGRYSADPARNLAISGANPYLTPNAALHVGLALHELAVNSVAYGALSSPDGRVEITTTPAEGADGLVFRWLEHMPPGRAPRFEQRRFGSVALERVVPASLGSSARLEAQDQTVAYTLRLPPDSHHLDD